MVNKWFFRRRAITAKSGKAESPAFRFMADTQAIS
jgi:hypothetical protein